MTFSLAKFNLHLKKTKALDLVLNAQEYQQNESLWKGNYDTHYIFLQKNLDLFLDNLSHHSVGDYETILTALSITLASFSI